jgi:hypothetical protein
MLAVHRLRDLHIDPLTHPRGHTYLSAASGLVQVQERLYVVADDEHHLAVFDLATEAPGRLIRLFEGDLPESRKKRKSLKPDVEALAQLPALPGYPSGALFGLGSGSRPNRNTGVLMKLGPDGGLEGDVRCIDMTPLYASLRVHFSDLNIEGALVVGDELLLLQRGNKGGSSNACIHFAWVEVLPWLLGQSAATVQATALQRYDLGAIEGIPLCFTDGAALPGGAWVFSAAAESVDDSYNDGARVGASIGTVDAAGTLRSMRALAPNCKVEGIAAQIDGDTMTLTMVTDADDPEIPSQLLSAKLSLLDAIGTA